MPPPRKSLMVDDRDPAAHWRGRALWLAGKHGTSIVELGSGRSAESELPLVTHLAFVPVRRPAIRLPPRLFATCAWRRFRSKSDACRHVRRPVRHALARFGRFEEARMGVEGAPRVPFARAHIMVIAAFSLALAVTGR